jgi:hypothetical protein
MEHHTVTIASEEQASSLFSDPSLEPVMMPVSTV